MTIEATVYVVDDDPGMRKSLLRLLQENDLRAEAFPDAESFLDACDGERRGCLVLDVKMPGMTGTELHARLGDEGIHLPVVMITGHGDVAMATASMHRGAVDFVEKPFRQAHLLQRVREALARDEEEHRQRVRAADLGDRFGRLTDREREVVELVVRGMTNKAIASRIGVSPQAIDARRARALGKVRVTNVPELVQAYVRWKESVTETSSGG